MDSGRVSSCVCLALGAPTGLAGCVLVASLCRAQPAHLPQLLCLAVWTLGPFRKDMWVPSLSSHSGCRLCAPCAVCRVRLLLLCQTLGILASVCQRWVGYLKSSLGFSCQHVYPAREGVKNPGLRLLEGGLNLPIGRPGSLQHNASHSHFCAPEGEIKSEAEIKNGPKGLGSAGSQKPMTQTRSRARYDRNPEQTGTGEGHSCQEGLALGLYLDRSSLTECQTRPWHLETEQGALKSNVPAIMEVAFSWRRSVER